MGVDAGLCWWLLRGTPRLRMREETSPRTTRSPTHQRGYADLPNDTRTLPCPSQSRVRPATIC